MIWLAEQGYQVIGVELSQIACDAFFEDNKIPAKITKLEDFILYSSGNIRIFCGDFFRINQAILGKIDGIYDRAALIALPTKVRQSYSEHLIKLMTEKTVLFLITMMYDQEELQGPPFSVDQEEIIALYAAHFDINQLYSKSFEIPAYLQDKGLHYATEQVYLLTRGK